MLTKELSLSVDEVRGERSVERTVKPPSALEAELGRLAGPHARFVAAGVLAVGVGLAAAYGAFTAAYVGAVVSVGLWWLSNLQLEPVTHVSVSETPGMTDREVWEALIINDEDERLREKAAEKEARKAKREANV